MTLPWKKIGTVALIGLILAVGVFLRAYDPEADAPYDLDWSQGNNTDGAWYMWTAWSKINPEAVDHDLPRQYNRPFITFYGQVFFKIFGVGLAQLNLLGILPSLLCAILLSLILHRAHGPTAALAGLVLGTFNYLFMMYGRLPIIYLWMCVVEVAAVLLWSHGSHSSRKSLLSRLAALLFMGGAALTFKMESLFFLLPLAFAEIAGEIDRRRSLATPTVAKRAVHFIGCLVMLFTLPAAIYLALRLPLFKRLSAKILDIHSFGDLPFQIFQFLELIRKSFLLHMPLEIPIAVLSAIFILFLMLKDDPGTSLKLQKIDYYFFGVFLFGLLTIFLFKYRPVRLLLFLVPATLYLVVSIPFYLHRITAFPSRISAQQIITWMIALLPFVAIAVLYIRTGSVQPISSFIIILLFTTIALAGVASLCVQILSPPPDFSDSFKRFWTFSLVITLLAFHIYHAMWWYRHRTWTIREAREDLQEILPTSQALAGPYSHLLAFGLPYRAAYLKLSNEDPNLIKRLLENQNIHRVVYDTASNGRFMNAFVEDWGNAAFLDKQYIRGFEIVFQFLPPSPQATNSNPVPMSLFEEGSLLWQERNFPEAINKWKESAAAFPNASAALRSPLYHDFQRAGFLETVNEFISEAVEKNSSQPLAIHFYLSNQGAAIPKQKQEELMFRLNSLTFKPF